MEASQYAKRNWGDNPSSGYCRSGLCVGCRFVAGQRGRRCCGRTGGIRALRSLSFDSPGRKKVGPSLAGVFGRKSGSEPGYSYSAALKAANITWDEHTLDQFLANPAADVHGTKMFISIPMATNCENLIAYLKTLK